MLNSREIVNNFFEYVEINNTNFFLKSIDIEISQGFILGLLLFNYNDISINGISNSVDCTPRLFADDTCLLMGASPINILELI